MRPAGRCCRSAPVVSAVRRSSRSRSPRSRRCARRCHIPVIGVGGIVDAASAQDFLTVGARAVQVGTATFVNPETALQVLDGLGV